MLSWRSIRLCVTASLALALVLSGLLFSGAHDTHPRLAAAIGLDAPRAATPTPKRPAAPAPLVRTQQTVVPSAPAGAAHNLVAELPQTLTKSYGMVGVTWSPLTAKTNEATENDITVKFRSLVNGSWTPWRILGLDDSQPGVSGRPGTEPIWVGKAQGVAVRVSTKSGRKPADIKVVTIDPGGSASTVTPASTDTTAPQDVTTAAYRTSGVLDGTVHATTVADRGDGTPTFTPEPTIISRASWGAGPGTTCDTPLTGNSTHGVIVHHTAGNNTYTKADSAKIVRGIQAYHTKGHGWCDIGYNFLVDKYGQIFEGRKGGVDRPVRAAHSGNGEVNTYDMGVSMMGDYDKVQPSPALESAMVKLIGWRMGTNYLPAKGTYHVNENNLTLNMIAGHRNVIGTECPGRDAYAWLSEQGGLRDRVEAYMSKYTSDIKTRAAALGASVTGPVFIGETETAGGRKTRFSKVDMYSKSGDGTRLVAAADGFRAKYASYGSHKSPLGFPTSDSPTISKSGTYVQAFEHGSIFATRSSSSTTLNALWGSIATTYDQLGGPSGKLGVPTASVSTVSDGSQAKFANGYIRYTTSTKKTVAYDTSGKAISTSSSTSSSSNDTLTLPSSGKIALTGRGYGHGIGMGQYGAQGAAIAGLTFKQILAYYYPGTTMSPKTGDIRVLLTKNTGSVVEVVAQTGLALHRMDSGSKTKLPTTMNGRAVDRWRILPNSSQKTQSTLQYRAGGAWRAFNKRWVADAQFEGPSTETLVLPNGATAIYRGAVRSALPNVGATTRAAVNVLSIESYVRGVVAAEMPSSWKPEALKAQAVAARTYGVQGLSSSRYYDMCDTTSCQVYRGVAGETSATDAAVSGTAGDILTNGGKPAFTQFSSSSGGYTAPGSQPYLSSHLDKYDNTPSNPHHVWTKTVTASAVQKAYPTIGTLEKIAITKRDGHGVWGGRVSTLTLTGSKKTVSVDGTAFRFALALQSTWIRF